MTLEELQIKLGELDNRLIKAEEMIDAQTETITRHGDDIGDLETGIIKIFEGIKSLQTYAGRKFLNGKFFGVDLTK